MHTKLSMSAIILHELKTYVVTCITLKKCITQVYAFLLIMHPQECCQNLAVVFEKCMQTEKSKEIVTLISLEYPDGKIQSLISFSPVK